MLESHNMFDTSNTQQNAKQSSSKLLTTTASSFFCPNNFKSTEIEDIEFSKADYVDIDKNTEKNYFIYNDVNINELDVPPFVKEMLMQLILENEEYEKLALELQSKCDRRSSTDNARHTRFNSEYYALLKKTEDLTEIINSFVKCGDIVKLPVESFRQMQKWGIEVDFDEIDEDNNIKERLYFEEDKGNKYIQDEKSASDKSAHDKRFSKNRRSLGKSSGENHSPQQTEQDFLDLESKQGVIINCRKLEEEYENCVSEYESKLESLTNELNIKNSQIEDLHLRIKTAQEEYEEILNKRIKDVARMEELEDTIFIIKKENDIKVENLLLQLKECQEGLSRRDHLVCENSLLNEKYDKAIIELNLSKEALEQTEFKSEKYLKTIEKLTEALDKKEKSFVILNLNKKEIENELVKKAQIYGFSLNKIFSRRQSISDIGCDGSAARMSEKKANFSTADNSRVPRLYLRKSNENSNGDPFHSDKNLHSICENSYDSENEKLYFESSNNCTLDYIDKLNEEHSNCNQNMFAGKAEENMCLSSNYNNNVNILDASIDNNEILFDTRITTAKQSDYKNNFSYNSSNNLLGIEDDSVLAASEFTSGDLTPKNNHPLLLKSYNEQKVNNISNSSVLCKNKNNFSLGMKRSSLYKSSNFLLNKRINLEDIIDANVDDHDNNHLTRRQSIMNFIGNYVQNNVIAATNKTLQSKEEPNQLGFNTNPNKSNLEISNYSVEIANKALVYKMDEADQRFTTNFTEASEVLVNDLKAQLEELTLKNIELQSILANEKFEKESEIKLQRMKIEKLNAALLELKKKIKGK